MLKQQSFLTGGGMGGGGGGVQWENCVNDTNKKYNPLPDHPKLNIQNQI